MASKITPQSGLLEVDGRLKVKDAIYANEVLTKGAVGKTLERQVLAAEIIDTTSGTIPIVVAINNASAYDITTELPKVKIFDDATGDKIIGVVVTTIQNAASGFALNYGPVTSNLDTSASTVNAPVYADPANGELTLTNTGKQVGTVLTLHASAGEILINVAGEAGSSGGGDTNFISDSSPETGLAASFSTYDDGATATPIDGTGGAASTLTFAAYTASPVLRTLGDWKLTKSAANGQGEGLAYDFSIEPAFKNQVLECSFNYNVSANYVSNDIGMYIYDVTNSILIYPNVINIPQTSGTNAKMFFKFFATSGVDYRVIFHVQSTNATTYTFSFTDFSVRPETKVIGAAISDWISYTPTSPNGSFGTLSNIDFKWRRVGDSVEIFGNFTSTSPTGSEAQVSLPDGLVTDSSKTPLITSNAMPCGIATGYAAVTNTAYVLIEPSKTYFGVGRVYLTENAWTKLTASAFNSSGNIATFNARIPISGWSSNVNLIQSQTEFSYNTDTAVGTSDTTSFGYGPEGTAIIAISNGGAGNDVRKRVRFKQPIQITDKLEFEINNGNGWQGIPYWNDATKLIWPIIDDYSGASGAIYGVGLKVINSTDVDVVFGGSGCGIYANGSVSWSGLTSFKWRVRKSASSATGEVAPFVGAKYTGTVSATSSSAAPVQWATKQYDTHNAVTTGSAWKFTAPVAGYYSVKCSLAGGAVSVYPSLYKNGTQDSIIGNESAASEIVTGSTDIKLEQGDYIDVRTNNSNTINGIASHQISIAKIG